MPSPPRPRPRFVGEHVDENVSEPMKTGKSRGSGYRASGSPSMNGPCETRLKSAHSARFNATRKWTFMLMVTTR